MAQPDKNRPVSRNDVRKGYQNIRVNVRVKGEILEKVIHELVQMSPVLDVVTNKVPVP
jgi:hypothetical protein